MRTRLISPMMVRFRGRPTKRWLLQLQSQPTFWCESIFLFHIKVHMSCSSCCLALRWWKHPKLNMLRCAVPWRHFSCCFTLERCGHCTDIVVHCWVVFVSFHLVRICGLQEEFIFLEYGAQTSFEASAAGTPGSTFAGTASSGYELSWTFSASESHGFIRERSVCRCRFRLPGKHYPQVVYRLLDRSNSYVSLTLSTGDITDVCLRHPSLHLLW